MGTQRSAGDGSHTSGETTSGIFRSHGIPPPRRKNLPPRIFRGELSNDELRRLIQNRRDNMSSLENFWGQCGYATYLCREDGTLHPSHSLDPGVQSDDNRGEMDFLAVSMN